MHEYTILSADEGIDASGNKFIDVEYQITKDGEEVYHGREGFSPMETSDAIRDTLQAKCEAWDTDSEWQHTLEERESADEAMNSTIDDLLKS